LRLKTAVEQQRRSAAFGRNQIVLVVVLVLVLGFAFHFEDEDDDENEDEQENLLKMSNFQHCEGAARRSRNQGFNHKSW
jgi:hypothetical protein